MDTFTRTSDFQLPIQPWFVSSSPSSLLLANACHLTTLTIFQTILDLLLKISLQKFQILDLYEFNFCTLNHRTRTSNQIFRRGWTLCRVIKIQCQNSTSNSKLKMEDSIRTLPSPFTKNFVKKKYPEVTINSIVPNHIFDTSYSIITLTTLQVTRFLFDKKRRLE